MKTTNNRAFKEWAVACDAMRPEYGGCKSWVTLKHELSTQNLTPILSDETFRAAVMRPHPPAPSP